MFESRNAGHGSSQDLPYARVYWGCVMCSRPTIQQEGKKADVGDRGSGRIFPNFPTSVLLQYEGCGFQSSTRAPKSCLPSPFPAPPSACATNREVKEWVTLPPAPCCMALSPHKGRGYQWQGEGPFP